jgi:hypothetical protein
VVRVQNGYVVQWLIAKPLHSVAVQGMGEADRRTKEQGLGRISGMTFDESFVSFLAEDCTAFSGFNLSCLKQR